MNMKKLTALLICAALLLSLFTACGANSMSPQSAPAMKADYVMEEAAVEAPAAMNTASNSLKGAGETGSTALPENRKFFDNLFASGEIDPCIIVSTTYYFDIEKDREERKRSGMVPAGDGGWPNSKGNFHREVVEDIIPAVEMRYHTYLTDPTPEGIRATRDHRAFSGYSRGSVATWKVFHYDFEYFRWYAPMSCHTTADHRIREPITEEEVLAYLKQPIEEHPDLPFFIYASNGYPRDIQMMTEQMNYITKADGFSFGRDPAVNNIYFAVSDFYHSDILVPYYYYNSLKVLFKG